MNGFERRKEQKKESIRRAALELFKVYGFRKVTVNDIAHKAGVSQVTIYNHFGSKDELVREVIKTAISSLVEKCREIIEAERPFLEKLELIVFGKAEVASQYQGELMQAAVRDSPEIQQFIESLWQQEVDQIVIDLVEEGKRLGYINQNLSQEAISYYFEIIRRGAFASSALLANIELDAQFARDVNNLFFYGLVGKKE
jgi:AcrR family transcriptional regulator